MNSDNTNLTHFPLTVSPNQHREWILWRFEDNNLRVIAAAKELTNCADEGVLEKRLKLAVEHHPSLSLSFNKEQPIAFSNSEFRIPIDTKYPLPDEGVSDAVARISEEAANEKFYSNDPFIRAIFIRSFSGENSKNALILITHNIIADIISLKYLLNEIDKSNLNGKRDDVFLKSVRNRIYSRREDDFDIDTIASYKDYLYEANFNLDLPTDKTRPPVFNNEGDYVRMQIPENVNRALCLLSELENVGLKAIVLTALGSFIYRMTKQQDFVFGIATDLRPTGFETAIGPFENIGILRFKFENNHTVSLVLNNLERDLNTLKRLHVVPFETLVEEINPLRDPSRTPLYQIYFAHDIYSNPSLPAPTGRVNTDLDVTLEESGDGLNLVIGYRRDLFQKATVECMCKNIIALLHSICKQPDDAIDTLAMCRPLDKAWIKSTLGIQKQFQIKNTIHDLVAGAAAKYPEKIALCSGETKISYACMNKRANQLAHRLIKLGVVPDSLVAVCMDRSVELIITLLAVLKAGGAYIPIDPANPKKRIGFILRDSKAQILLTESKYHDKFSGFSVQILVLGAEGDECALEPTNDPDVIVSPDNLAYIIYTSGSTGRPKGVLIEHRNVVRLFCATHKKFQFNSEDVWTMFHSVAFDFSVWEIWGALINGGRLVVVPYLTTRSPWDFLELLSSEKVTVLNQTPSAFRQLVQAESESENKITSLRLVIFGGEALEFESLRPWFKLHGDRSPRLINMYGITETCVHVTYKPVSISDLDAGLGSSIIGFPIADLSAYVVDRHLQLLPPGVPGELVIGGAGLARGYHDRPDLTAERFIPDPFSDNPNDRLYRSGDLARILPSGELDYLGRLDQQVQIRGFRIETGEIEAVLRRSGIVEDVSVLPLQRESSESALIAYVVTNRPISECREAAKESLPDYMIPDFFVSVPKIPMTTNGKVDRKALPEPKAGTNDDSPSFAAPDGELERQIAQIWCEVLGAETVSTNESFFEIGGTSLGLVRIASKLRGCLQKEIKIATLFQFPTVSALAKHFGKDQAGQSQLKPLMEKHRTMSYEDEPIAIIGMAGRFPGAGNIEGLWDLLEKGKESITFFKEYEIDSSIDRSLISHPNYVKARGILQDADLFDAAFFGISSGEAEVTDPQQRILLEIAWEALENAGIDPDCFSGLIATYAGVYNNSYYTQNLLKNFDAAGKLGSFQVMLGNEKDFVATRIAHRLGLNGPAISIHTACSTSLVAVVQAFFALRARQCDLALAGAAAVTSPQRSGYLYQEGGMLSIDGHTRPFDKKATGTVFSDGAAIVVLRRLTDALEAGDTIHAVIRGAAINNDGGQRMSFSAPTVQWQADVVDRAISMADVNPESISYIEAHGTATPLGDPVEIAGLKQAYEKWTRKRGFCALGSIKSNLGHLTAPAGVAGLIKTILSFEKEVIPPTLGFSSPNPEIGFEDSPFFVAAEPLPWLRDPRRPRRAGVSSFGVGGTNAHIVIEEPPTVNAGQSSEKPQLLIMSAKTKTALKSACSNLADYFHRHTKINLSDAAFTLQNGRREFAFRQSVVASSVKDAVDKLRSLETKEEFTGKVMSKEPSIIFLFPGQGAQSLNMGRELYDTEVLFREKIDHCADMLKTKLGLDIRSIIYPANADSDLDESLVNQTWLAQPAIFIIEYALAQLWMDWGVQPSALLGHSIGEYVAAVLAETLTLDEALTLLSERARLMQALPTGAMLSVRMKVDELEPLLPEDASIAAINSPLLCVVSGPKKQLQQLSTQLQRKKVATRFLHTSHAFHSAMMEPMLPEFAVIAKQIQGRPPKIPWLSTCTGNWITFNDLSGGEYWVRQVRKPVLFSEALSKIIENQNQLMLEVGPGQSLIQLARLNLYRSKAITVIPSLCPAGDTNNDLYVLLNSLGIIWANGSKINWKRFSSKETRRRIPLPTYPFERKRYWIDPVSKDVTDADTTTIENRAKDDSFHKTNEMCHNKSSNSSVIENDLKLANERIDADRMESKMDGTGVLSISAKERWISGKLAELFEDISGETIEKERYDVPFLEFGFDSLLLTQASVAIKNQFKVEVAFRKLLEKYNNINNLVAYLIKNVDDIVFPAETSSKEQLAMNSELTVNERTERDNGFRKESIDVSSQSPIASENINDIFLRQLAIIENQLKLIQNNSHLPSYKQNEKREPVTPQKIAAAEKIDPPNEKSKLEKVEIEQSEKKFVGPQLRIKKHALDLTPIQRSFLDDFSKRYIEKTKNSKKYTELHRSHLADPRVVSGFNLIFKELIYPIVTNYSQGSRLWDIDGNEYVDWLNGFGSNFFGYSAPFIIDAIQAQMKKGIEIGPQHELAGEVAEMICQTVQQERAAFCNTGSEAVLGALRIARTVTGRDKIAMFSGAYHGIFNEVINRGKKDYSAMPAAPGIPRDAVNNMIVLDYDDPASLEVLRQRGKELAAILVEPVQSRAPEIQPKSFLKKLREIADQNDIVLIFDEVVTGFRTCPGGAQEYFNVKADIATYGKVIGGGWPIGVIAGKKKFMDALDGGYWQYGDDSIPEVGVTYFAGTFVRHPPALAAAKAALTYLLNEGPGLQETLNKRCTAMVEKLNLHLSISGVPIQLRHFASIIKIEFLHSVPFEEMLFFLLRGKKVHAWHHRPCFLTLAHTDEDIEFIVNAFRESVKEMQEGGFLSCNAISTEKIKNTIQASSDRPPISGARLGKDAKGNPAWFIKDPERPGKYMQIGG